MSLRKRIIMNAGSNGAAMVVAAAVGLVLIPIIWRDLGVAGFGVWALLSTGLRYPMILERAFSLSTNRFVAFYRDDENQLSRFVSASFVILLALAVLTVAAAMLLSFVIADIFTAITDQLAGDAQITCILVGVTLAFKILQGAFSGALRGYQYHTRSNAVVIAANLLRAVLTVGLLAFWKSMIAVQLAFAIAAAVSALLMFLVARKTITALKIDILKFKTETLRELLRFTGHATARSGSTIFMYSTIALLVGKAGTAEDMAVYDVASRIPGFIRGFLAGAQNVFLPAVTSLHANGQIEKIKAVVIKGAHISSAAACASLILLFVFTEEILDFWLKGDVQPGTVEVMRVLIISVIARGFFGIWLPSLVGMAILAAVSAIVLVLVLLQGFVAIPIPMAPAIVLVAILWSHIGLWLPFYGLRKLSIRPYEYFKDSVYQPLIASMVAIVALWALSSILPKESIHWLVMLLLSAAVVAASFTAISLRKEAADLVVAARRRFESRR
ncbi:MAG: oligosaccharide flippase family protein [Planctomycetota bacterium]